MPKAVCLNCKIEFTHGYSTTGKYCSLKCHGEARTESRISRDKMRFAESTLTSRKRIKELVLERDGHKCSVCQLTEWMGKPITLWCDHIDGNATNNHPSNFRMICPNCDSQSETFGAKNYGNGRKSRGLPQYG